MDENGNYTDRRGALLLRRMRVKMARDEYQSGAVGSGMVDSLPPEGSDWYGFPLVEFDHDGRKRHVPDTALIVDNTAWITLVNRYGRFTAAARFVDRAMVRHLPASPDQLREKYRKLCKAGPESEHDYRDTEVSELIVMIAHLEMA